MLNNASTFEIVWTVMALLGQVCYAVVLWYGFGDRRYLRRPVSELPERRALGSRQTIATMYITISLLLGGVEFVLMAAGIITLFYPNTTTKLTATGAIFLFSMFLMHCFLIGVALVLLTARSRLLAKIEADREHLEALHATALTRTEEP